MTDRLLTETEIASQINYVMTHNTVPMEVWLTPLCVSVAAAQDTKTAPITRRETAAGILEFVKDWSGIDLDEFEAKYGLTVRDGNCRVFPLPYLIQRWIESKYLGEVK